MTNIMIAAIIFAGLVTRAAVAADLSLKHRPSQPPDVPRQHDSSPTEREILYKQFQDWLKKQLRPRIELEPDDAIGTSLRPSLN